MTGIRLLVEGFGDQAAVPELIRRILSANGKYHVQIMPSPMMAGGIAKLRRQGELERFLGYAALKAGEVILLVLDCEDDCAVHVADEFLMRARNLQPPIGKPFFVALLVKEFETLFLHSRAALARAFPDFGWRKPSDAPDRDWETVRGAKEQLKRFLGTGRSYKELTDQPRFAAKVDLDVLRERSRSFRHLENVLLEIAAP